MAKVRMKASSDAFEKAGQDQGDFVVPAPGYYVAVAKEINAGFSKTDGVEDKKRPRLECIYQIEGVGRDNQPTTENYGNIWDYVSFSAESEWKRAEFLLAFGLADGAFDGDIETDDLLGTRVLLRIKHEKGRQKDEPARAKVAKLLPYVDGDSNAAFGSGSDTNEPEFGGEEDAGEGVEFLTEEGLGELELKELGEVAKEFDLDPTEFIVRNKAKKVDTAKTQAALIEAILEAQGVEEDGAEAEAEGGDDSPF